MRATQEETFTTSRGRFTFHVTQLGGIAAGRMAIRVGPLLPKIFGAIASGLDLKKLQEGGGMTLDKLKKIDLSKLDLAGIGSALASITPTDFDQLTVELLSGGIAVGTDSESGEQTKIELNRAAIDALFTGQVWELFKLVGFAAKINFFGFTSGPNVSAT